MKLTWPTWLTHNPAWWIAVASALVDLFLAFYPSGLTGDEKAGIIALVTLLANGLGTGALVTSTAKLTSLGVTITPVAATASIAPLTLATVVPPPMPPPIPVPQVPPGV